jgi:Uma2 family endonuclease
VPWSTYVVLRDSVDSSGVRMTYLKGALEITSPSREHEVDKTQIARLLELFCFEREIPLYAYGSTTFRREKLERGLEPDECYCRGADREVPDITLEVIVTSPLLDNLEVYCGLGVREVWVFRNAAFQVLALQGDSHAGIPRSEVFPRAGPSRTRAPRADPGSTRRAARVQRRGSWVTRPPRARQSSR